MMKLLTLGLALVAAAIAAQIALSAGSAATFNVNADDDFFQPSTVNIAVGDTVQWNFVGANPHSVTSQTAGLFDSGVQTGGTFSHTFNSAGTFAYYCTVHGTIMSGTVVVSQPAPTNTPPPAPTNTPLPEATAEPGVTPDPEPDAPTTGDPPTAPGTDGAPGASEGGAADTVALPASGSPIGAQDGAAPLLPLALALSGLALAGAAVLRRTP